MRWKGIAVLPASSSEEYLENAFGNSTYHPTERKPMALALDKTSPMLLTLPNQSDDDVARLCKLLATVLTDAAR